MEEEIKEKAVETHLCLYVMYCVIALITAAPGRLMESTCSVLGNHVIMKAYLCTHVQRLRLVLYVKLINFYIPLTNKCRNVVSLNKFDYSTLLFVRYLLCIFSI